MPNSRVAMIKISTRSTVLVVLFALATITLVIIGTTTKPGCSCGKKHIKTNLSMAAERKFVTVSTEYGQVRGQSDRTQFEKRPYFAFKGIPYAKPPVGELRFKVCYLSSSPSSPLPQSNNFYLVPLDYLLLY